MRGFFISRRGWRAARSLLALIGQFGSLKDYPDQRTSDLPLGIRPGRLSLAVAIVHEPEILILDEPTSGVDPLARDRFWEALVDLSRSQGVTIFDLDPFHERGAANALRPHRADGFRPGAGDRNPGGTGRRPRRREPRRRVYRAILKRGRPVRTPPPCQQLRRSRRHQLMWCKLAHASNVLGGSACSACFAYAIREALELAARPDPARRSACSVLRFLMLVFGFGVSTDVVNLSFRGARSRSKVPQDLRLSRGAQGARAISSRRRAAH